MYVRERERVRVLAHVRVCVYTYDTHTCIYVYRDGIPNRYLQKILRELGAIDLLIENVQLPFQKGVLIDELMGANKDHYAKLVSLINMQYRYTHTHTNIRSHAHVQIHTRTHAHTHAHA